MQVYGIKMFNFFRFGENNNSVVFDLLDEDRKALSNNEITYDDLYDKLKADPVNYIKKVKEKGVTNLISIAGVIGDNYDKSNGVGKSTVLEAICYAHYDRIVRKNVNTDKIEKAGLSVVTRFNGSLPKKLTESYVEEIFEEDGKIYRIKRGHRYSDTRKSHSPIVEFVCISENKTDSKSSHRSPDTSSAIEKVNGMSYDIFVNGAMFGQNDAGKFLTGTDKTRKEMMVNLLHLEEVVSGCLEAVRIRKNNKEKDVGLIKSKIEIIAERLKREDTEDILEGKIKEKQNQIKECEKNIDEISNKLEKLSDSEVLKKINDIKDSGRNIKTELDSLKGRKESQIKEWKELYEKADSKIKAERKNAEDIETKKKEKEHQIKLKNDQIKKFDIKEFDAKMKKVNRAREVKDKYSESLLKIQFQRELIVKDQTRNESTIASLQKEITSLQDQIKNSGEKSEFICDKCKSKVTKEHILSEIEINVKARSVCEKNLMECNKNLDGISKDVKEAQNKLDKINEWINNGFALESQKKTHQDSLERIKELQNDVEELEKRMVEVTKECNCLEEQKKTYRSKGDEIKKEYDSKISDLEVSLSKISEELKIAQKDAEGTQNKINELENHKRIQIKNKSEFNSQIGSYKNGIETIKKDQYEIELLNKKQEEENLVLKRLLILEDVFGLEGIQTRIVKKFLPLLNLYIKQTLDILSSGSMTIEMFINDKSKVDMSISGGTGSTFNLLSGGEKMLCRLSVDIGLALLSFSRCAKKPEIICLDEIFGPLDDSHTEAVFVLLDKLRSQFSRVLVISHKTEINEMIDRRILIEKETGDFGRSKVKAII